MSALTPFRQAGPTVIITAAVTAPAAVQVLMNEGVGNQQYVLTNSGANIAVMAMGQNQTQCIQNAGTPQPGAPTQTYPLLNGSQVTITGPQNAWFTGTTVTGTSAVYITPGYGQ